MKHGVRRLLSLFIILGLLTGIVPLMAVPASAAESAAEAGSQEDRYGRAVLSGLENSKALLYAYDRMVEGVAESSDKISIYNGTDSISQEELELTVDVYRKDYPNHFWLDLPYQMEGTGKTMLSVIPQYIFSGSELDTQKAAFESAAEKILSGIAPSMSEYEKELYLHDTLAARISYNFSNNAHNAYGALVEGVAVCDGYAKAFQYLLQRAGIQSFLITGTSINPITGFPEGHAWNLVQIDGEYYHADLTWDDQGDGLFHTYFNLTDTLIKEDHTIDPTAYTLPVCDAAQAHYFHGKAEYLEVYTIESVAALLNPSGKTHVYIVGDAQAFLDWFSVNILEIATHAGATGSLTVSVSGLGRELILDLGMDPTPDPEPEPGPSDGVPGDIDRNADVNVDDVLALLWYVLFPDDYPIDVAADFDRNGATDVDDVLALLWYVLFPEDYPLN